MGPQQIRSDKAGRKSAHPFSNHCQGAVADAQEAIWKTAAKHSYNQGLESGIPSLEAARRAKRTLHKQDLHKEAAALEAVIVGVYRPSKTEGSMGWCRRCAKKVKLGRWHDIYQCEDNDRIENAIFVRATRTVRRQMPAAA